MTVDGCDKLATCPGCLCPKIVGIGPSIPCECMDGWNKYDNKELTSASQNMS